MSMGRREWGRKTVLGKSSWEKKPMNFIKGKVMDLSSKVVRVVFFRERETVLPGRKSGGGTRAGTEAFPQQEKAPMKCWNIKSHTAKKMSTTSYRETTMWRFHQTEKKKTLTHHQSTPTTRICKTVRWQHCTMVEENWMVETSVAWCGRSSFEGKMWWGLGNLSLNN